MGIRLGIILVLLPIKKKNFKVAVFTYVFLKRSEKDKREPINAKREGPVLGRLHYPQAGHSYWETYIHY